MLVVHRAERADRLVEALAEVMVTPLDDPLAKEVVAVPTRGVERWLTQRLSHRLGERPGRGDGVCANVDFPFPGALIGAATAVACGIDPQHDPWPPQRMVWPLLELVDSHLGEPFLASLAGHLRAAAPAPGDGRGPRRFATVRHLADLYDHYGVHRPAMVRAWAAAGSGAGEAGGGWQADLWRRLRERLGVDSPAERLAVACSRLAGDPRLVDLPARLSLFGLTRLPASYLDVLEAVAAGRDVHLFLLHPSAALWGKVEGVAPHPPPDLRRAVDPTADVAANPLVRSWGRDAREMQLVLAARGVGGGRHYPLPEGGPTLLGRIQADVRADRKPPPPADPDGRPTLDDHDSSVRIHSCHGRSRQVEVMRDAVLHLLQSDPTLEPRDIIVMCPDIEAFAPLIHASFDPGEDDDDGGLPLSVQAGGHGAHDGHDGQSGTVTAGSPAMPQLRVRLADRALRQTNPLLGVATRLLELAGSRVSASEVLDLAATDPVRRRFGFDDDDLTQVERWLVDAGVRWGLDAPHRERWHLGGLGTNTWESGLDRLLLGVAMADEDQRLFGGVLPVDDVGSGLVSLAGRLAELVSRLGAAVRSLCGPQPAPAWRDALASATEALALAGAGDEWQHDQLRRILDEVVEEASAGDGHGRPGAPVGAVLDLSEARSLLEHRLQGRPTRANFRTGDLTVCTLVPMRSVPHRVVCLLGLDDGVFPRHTERDGDDLLLDDPCVGDREARSEDRQLLLDALLAATDHLVITFSGRDERTNRPRPPAVPIAELLDAIDRTVRVEGGTPRDRVLVNHPLQAFDPRNFAPGGLVPAARWSFDPLSLAGGRSLTGPRRERDPFLSGPLPHLDSEVVELESLVRFVEHPVKAFLRERLGVYLGGSADEVSDSLPVELDGLAKWGVGDRLLAARLSGSDARRAEAAERARGLLPPGPLADSVLGEVSGTVEAMASLVTALPCCRSLPRSLEVNLRLPDGRLLVGTVPGVRDATIVRCVYSSLAAKHRAAAWVRLLALSACRPELEASAVTVGRGPKRRGQQMISVATVGPLGLPGAGAADRRRQALGQLAAVVDLWDRGMREPLPLFCNTSAAWAEAARRGSDPAEAARGQWTSGYNFGKEDREPEHRLVHGGTIDFSHLLDLRAHPDEAGPGWAADEPARVGRLARRLWDAILDHERCEEHEWDR